MSQVGPRRPGRGLLATTRPNPPSARSSPAPRRRVEERTASAAGSRRLAIIAVWIVVWYFTKGTEHARAAGHVAHRPPRPAHRVPERRCSRAATPTRSCSSPTAIAEALRGAVEWLQRMVVLPNLPRPVPEIGWLGVVAIATYVGLVVASWRIALLVAGVVPLLRRLRLLAGLPRPADHHRHLGRARRRHRDAAGRPDRHQPTGQPGRHALPRLHADDADVRLPAADRAVLRHRPERGAVVSTLIYALPPLDPDRRLRHPRGVGDHRSRPPTRPARPTGSGCSRCSSRWPARRSSSASTRPPWRRCRWPPSPPSSTAPGSASPCSPASRINDVGTALRARRADRGDGGDARPDHDRGERAGREGRARWRRRPAAAPDRPVVGGGRGDARRDLPLAHLREPGRVPGVHASATRSRRAVSDGVDWFTDTFGGVDRVDQGRHHQPVPQPDAVAARRVARGGSRSWRSPRSPSSSEVSARW